VRVVFDWLELAAPRPDLTRKSRFDGSRRDSLGIAHDGADERHDVRKLNQRVCVPVRKGKGNNAVTSFQ
jgi:hypothetical protein